MTYRILPIVKLYSTLVREGVQYPEVCLKQIFLETGYLSSTIYKENNNILGMKEPVYRPTTAIGSNRGHARYDNPLDCIKDYVLWQKYWIPKKGKDIKSTEDYMEFLRLVGYAEDQNYINKLKAIDKKLIRLVF